MEKAVILSFDLGLRGDYQGLYEWLDEQHAKECGSNVAAFSKEFTPSDRASIIQSLKKELSERIKLNESDRIYVLILDEDGRMKGHFIFGQRKRAPWEGFSEKYITSEQDVF